MVAQVMNESRLTRKTLDEHVHTLVPELVSSSSEEVHGILKVEVVMTIKVASNEVVDLLLGLNVQVLELVHRRELLDVETVREDAIWFTFEEVFRFERSDVGDGGEDVGGVGRGALDAVANGQYASKQRWSNSAPVIDTSLPSFMIDIKVL